MIPPLDWEDFQELLFGLMYTQHGGSGLGMTLADVLELDFDQVEWLSDRLESQRSAEARAIRSGR